MPPTVRHRNVHSRSIEIANVSATDTSARAPSPYIHVDEARRPRDSIAQATPTRGKARDQFRNDRPPCHSGQGDSSPSSRTRPDRKGTLMRLLANSMTSLAWLAGFGMALGASACGGQSDFAEVQSLDDQDA